MISREDLEGFLGRLDQDAISSEEVEDGLWVLTLTENDTEVVVNFAPPVVVMRVNVMKLPAAGERRCRLFEKLLKLNSTDLVHGSYGIEGDLIVITEALELENLDFNEFQASFDSINLALASHLPALAEYGEA